MKDEGHRAFANGERLEGGIRTAVAAWCENRDAAKDQYGPIASWNTSEITNMSTCPGPVAHLHIARRREKSTESRRRSDS